MSHCLDSLLLRFEHGSLWIVCHLVSQVASFAETVLFVVVACESESESS